MLSSIFAAERCVGLLFAKRILSLLYQIDRLSNPFGSTLSFMLIFGNQLLALTEDGKRMLVWDTAESCE